MEIGSRLPYPWIMNPKDTLASILDAVPDPAFMKDHQHRWVGVNDALCDLVGLSREDLLGKTDADIFAPALAVLFSSADDHVLATGKPAASAWRADRAELLSAAHAHRKGRLEARSHKSLLIGPSGERYVFGLVRDVTELREIEDSLLDAMARADNQIERRRDFTGAVAGALQEPLERMRNDASLLRTRDLPPDSDALAARIEAESSRLLDLVQDLFDLAQGSNADHPSRRIARSKRHSAPRPTDAPSTPTAGIRALIVEDNRTNQFVLRQQLEKLGCHASLAENGAEALRMLEKERFDIVLMDCQMPVMDGFEATRRWRRIEQERGLGRTPVVAVTAMALLGEHDDCVRSGMDAVLSKPLRLPTLEQALLRWANAKRD